MNVGDAAGPVLPLPSALLRSRNLQILGWTNQALSWVQQCEILADVLALADQGRLVGDATVVPLEEAAAAWDRDAPASSCWSRDGAGPAGGSHAQPGERSSRVEPSRRRPDGRAPGRRSAYVGGALRRERSSH